MTQTFEGMEAELAQQVKAQIEKIIAHNVNGGKNVIVDIGPTPEDSEIGGLKIGFTQDPKSSDYLDTEHVRREFARIEGAALYAGIEAKFYSPTKMTIKTSIVGLAKMLNLMVLQLNISNPYQYLPVTEIPEALLKRYDADWSKRFTEKMNKDLPASQRSK